jgi:hypothetical protein
LTNAGGNGFSDNRFTLKGRYRTQTVQKENNKNSDEFQEDLDTDTYNPRGFEGVERDKRGELLILLPDNDRSVARRRGFIIRHVKEGEPAGGVSEEKGSLFSGILRDDKGLIPVGQAETKGFITEVPDSTIPGDIAAVDYGQTEILIPERSGEPSRPTIADFDLDFGPSTKKEVSEKSHEPPAREPEEDSETRKVKIAPAWMPPEEAKPLTPTTVKIEREKVEEKLQFDEPELPDTGPPVIIKDPRTKTRPEPKAGEKPEAPPLKAHSYLEGESVVKKAAPTTTRKPARKKKMKLPKRVKENKTSLVLVLLMILLYFILAAVLAVQHVAEARNYYDSLTTRVFKTKKRTPLTPSSSQPKDDLIEITISGKKVMLKKGTDLKAVKTFTNKLGEIFSRANKAASGKERK